MEQDKQHGVSREAEDQKMGLNMLRFIRVPSGCVSYRITEHGRANTAVQRSKYNSRFYCIIEGCLCLGGKIHTCHV